MLTLRNMIPYYRFTPAKTKFVLVIVSVTVLIAGVAPAATILKVDFNSDQDGGGNSAAAGDPSLSPANHNQPGWSSYHANHEVAAEFTTANYGGITLTPVWPNTTNNNVRQSIDACRQRRQLGQLAWISQPCHRLDRYRYAHSKRR